MIVCGDFTEDFLLFPPTLILEISSIKTKLRDRNTKYNLYKVQGIKYYLHADTEKKLVGVFELTDGKYVPVHETYFKLTDQCIIDLDVFNIWQLM